MADPTIRVARIDTRKRELREEVLDRLRVLKSQPMSIRFWRWETHDGRVLAEQNGGPVVIYREVCREVLGEEV
jgi:hypothetical protein